MKKTGLLCTLCVVLVLIGTLMAIYWAKTGKGGYLGGLPEGYEENAAEGKEAVRVERLDIEESVFLRYKSILEVVAFAPGSGWLKYKTGSGISPTLSFNGVSHGDIQRFNSFSQSLGLPIHATLYGKVLRLTGGSDNSTILASRKAGGANSAMKGVFYKPEEPPRLAISRDENGRVFLVEAKGKNKKADAFVAQVTDKEATAK